MTKKLLQFVDLKKETPPKRGTTKEVKILKKFTMTISITKQQNSLADVHNVEFLFVKYIAH